MNTTKLKEIMNHPDFKGRTITTLCLALTNGVEINQVDVLFKLVQEAYQEGKHLKPSKVKRSFKKQYSYLVQQLS